MQGESAVINTADESGVLRKARFVMHKEHTRGEADEVLRNVDRSLDLEDLSLIHISEPPRPY